MKIILPQMTHTSPISGWLHGLCMKPLIVTIGHHSYSFRSLPDFTFALGGRTNIPLTKFVDMLRLSTQDLRHEACNLRPIEQQIVDVLKRSSKAPEKTSALIRVLGTKGFSKDHDWRDIIASLNRLGPEFDDYKKVAIVTYLQYLGSRLELLDILYRIHTGKSFADDGSTVEEAQKMPGIGTRAAVLSNLQPEQPLWVSQAASA